jgi:hypothetical protein
MSLAAFTKNYRVVFHEETLSYTIEQRCPKTTAEWKAITYV